MTSNDLEPLLLRQLRRVGHVDTDLAPRDDVWRQLLQRISSHYRHMSEDREILVRSLELSTAEMASTGGDLSANATLQLVQNLADAFLALSSAGESQPSSVEDLGQLTRRLDDVEVSLLEQLNRMSSGGLRDRTELTALRHHFISLSDSMKRILSERAAYQSTAQELERARAAQQMLLPEQDVFRRPFLELAAHSRPASVGSGDWWAVHDLPDGRVLIVVGDVTGHGLPASIMTGVAKAACDVVRGVYGERLSPGQLLQVMNQAIESSGRQQYLMTCVAAVFNPHEQCLSVANAGHLLPIVARTEGGTVRLASIRAHGTPLGSTHNATYVEVDVALLPDDVVVLYSDGVLERENRSGEAFGIKRLHAIVEQSTDFGPAGLRDSVLHHLERHAEGRPPDDDTTLVVIGFGDKPDR